jgi:hypothetical protein
MPATPDAARLRRDRRGDPRYLEGQRILVEAIRYLVRDNVLRNLSAIELLSDHFRTQFRMTDKPALPTPHFVPPND